jgi:hypothetical protein
MTDAFLERRRAAAAAAWNLDRGVVLVTAGDTILVPGRVDRATVKECPKARGRSTSSRHGLAIGRCAASARPPTPTPCFATR